MLNLAAMSDKYERLLDYLSQNDGWVTAAELADLLGVTTRSVRSYVTAAKAAAHPLPIIAASTSGYRLNREAYATFSSENRTRDGHLDTPRDRVHHLARRLTEAPGGLDIHALADSLYVSESTIESDLRKVKALGEQAGLTLSRSGSTVTLAGSESDHRRLLSRLFRTESAQGFLELENEFSHEGMRDFKTALIAMLDSQGYFVNEYGVSSVLLHVAIAVERVGQHRVLPAAGSTTDGITVSLAELVRAHFDVELDAGDLEYIAKLLTTRVITRGKDKPVQAVIDDHVVPADLATVRRIVEQVAQEYLVDLDDEAFMVRLSLHLGNLVARANDNTYSRNPLGRSIKTSYPMIYDVAVFMASLIQRERSITINDDEISYLALHLGSHLERQNRREERVSVAIVLPGYYDLHQVLRQKVESALGDEVSVEVVVTRTDVNWDDFSTDLVLTTITDRAFAENVVVIQPFLTDADVDRVQTAAARIRRSRRLARLRKELERYFVRSAFVRGLDAGGGEEGVIRHLGSLLVAEGVIDQDYVERTIERERLSSTAFTDALAVPHALGMTATRTAIAVGIAEPSIPWGEGRVQVVAVVAFSETDREAFQTVFEQFVEVFSERDSVHRIVRRATDFTGFLDELVAVIDG